MAEDLGKLIQQPDFFDQNNSINQHTRNYCNKIWANIIIFL